MPEGRGFVSNESKSPLSGASHAKGLTVIGEALLGWLVVGGCDKADSEYNGKENQTTRHRRSDNSI